MKLDILYEDENCLFINKPAGISVHGDGKTVEVTLADILVAQFPGLENVGEPMEIKHGSGPSTFVSKPGLVHRLDKETSGVMPSVLSRNGPTVTLVAVFCLRNLI